jgi:hypothetical protein
LPHEEPLPPRTDLWTAAVFLLLGLSIFALALKMPTFTERQGVIYTAPGLVPGLYGLIIAGLSIWLAARAIRRGALRASAAMPDAAAAPAGTSNVRLALAALLCLGFVVGLIGRMPFWVAAATFVTLFIVLFEWQRSVTWQGRLKGFSTAVLQGLLTGLAVTLVFEKIFYVRLP